MPSGAGDLEGECPGIDWRGDTVVGQPVLPQLGAVSAGGRPGASVGRGRRGVAGRVRGVPGAAGLLRHLAGLGGGRS